MLRQGFQSDQYHIYGFDNSQEPQPYLSEYLRKGYTGQINDDSELLNDKERFYGLLRDRGYGNYIPDQYGFLKNGVFEPLKCNYQGLLELVQDKKIVVIKKIRSGGGDDVYICKWSDKPRHILINGEPHTIPKFKQRVATWNTHLVQEYVEQGGYLEEIFPKATNTARLLVMNPSDGQPFISAAIQRIGTEASGHLDNFQKGGLSVELDTETGVFGKGVRYADDKQVEWHKTHPDTGSRIDGVEIPGWEIIHNQFVEIVNGIPEIRYAGWDILITGEEEFVIVEANNRSGVRTLQAHKPLLDDERVVQFYRNHGVPV